MGEDGAVVFWSYAHADNRAVGGRIADLAERLRAEYEFLSGTELQIFVDRSGIGWGDEWRRIIDSAIVRTAFFVPILSPTYFKRPECRREFQDFLGHARSLGVSDFVLPIRFAPVAQLDETNSDELIRSAGRMQYADWTRLRLVAPDSEAHIQGVHDLAQRLIILTETMLLAGHDRSGGVGDVSPTDGFAEVMDRINSLLPEWAEGIELEALFSDQIDNVYLTYSKRINNKNRFAVEQKIGKEWLLILQRELAVMEVYAARTMELDPLVRAAIRLAGDRTEMLAQFDSLAELLIVFEANMQADEEREAGVQVGNFRHVRSWAEERAHTSNTLRDLNSILNNIRGLTGEANDMVRRWRELLESARSE